MVEKSNILIAVPCYGETIRPICTDSLNKLTRVFARAGIGYETSYLGHADIEFVRNLLCSAVVNSQRFTHILSIDYDMGFEPSSALRMLKARKPVIACVAPGRSIDINKALDLARGGADNTTSIAKASRFAYSAPNSGITIPDETGAVEVEKVGAAFMLIERATLTKLAAFVRVDDRQAPTVYGFFDRITDGPARLSEDFSFCRRWKDSGGTIHAFVDEDIKHVGTYTYEAKLSDATRVTS